MTDFGTIKTYDRSNGRGMIAPEAGGDALSFRRSDLQQRAHQPELNARYGYDLANASDGKLCATNLHREESVTARSQPTGKSAH